VSHDPYSSTYTEEELASLPQTPHVFDAPELVGNDHEWVQEGYFITDACDPKTPGCHAGGLPIGGGNLLIKEKGVYRIVDELTRK